MESTELIKLCHEIILNFFKKNKKDTILINQLAKFLESFPIEQGPEIDMFLASCNSVAQVAVSRDGKWTMLLKTTINMSMDDILIVIHEYCHAFSEKFSVSSTKLGNLHINTIFEEAIAVNFSEACINEWLKEHDLLSTNKNGVIERASIYSDERNILNTILFALKDDFLRTNVMIEYILGDKQKFYSICSENLGQNFYDIFSIIEKEIAERNRNPNGYGFKNRKAIKEIYDLVSNKLLELIPEELLLELSWENMDFKDNNNRYFKTSYVIKKRFFMFLAIKLITNGELDELDVENLLLYDHLNNLDIKELKRQAMLIKEWTIETGYTLKQIIQLGIYPEQIDLLLPKYNGMTGEKIDRKLKVETFIQKLKTTMEVDPNSVQTIKSTK